MKTLLRYITTHWILWLIVAVLVLGAGAYFMGYRIDGAGFTKVGTLSIDGLPAGTTLYIDGTSRVFASAGVGSVSLSPGSHTVIVDAPGHQPWTERFDVESGKTVSPRPLLIKDRKDAHRQLVGTEVTSALSLVRSAAPLASKAKPLTRANGCALIYASGNRVLAEATTTPSCTPPPYLACTPVSEENPDGGCSTTIIRTDKAPITGLLPYPGREDAVIVLSGATVYALELDPREPQTYVTLFSGKTIGMVPWATTSIAVTNGTAAFELSL